VCETDTVQTPATFLLLGPPGVRSGSGVRLLRGRRQNLLYAILALGAGTPIATDDLLDALWQDHPPSGPGGALQSQVSRLRAFLGGSIASGVGTYALATTAAQVDVHRFDDLVRVSRQLLDAGAPALARQRVGAALSLWRGTPFPELAGVEFAAAETARLDELRLEALVVRAQADLLLGRASLAAISLRSLTLAYPLREDLWAMLVRALYAAGRTAEALTAYRSARHRLLSELGLEPGPHLRELEIAVLRHDPALAPPGHPCAAHAQIFAAACGPPPRLATRVVAVQAFLDRVRARLPGYDPGHGEGAGIVRLVELLEGDPLRIELAAAQLPRLSVQELVDMHERAGAGSLPVRRD
jgi:DNA-binding SARP family transcriptional activator